MDTSYEDTWNEEDVPLVDAVERARNAAEGDDGEVEDEYVRAHRELDAPPAEEADDDEDQGE